jgi:hypothetical protein
MYAGDKKPINLSKCQKEVENGNSFESGICAGFAVRDVSFIKQQTAKLLMHYSSETMIPTISRSSPTVNI